MEWVASCESGARQVSTEYDREPRLAETVFASDESISPAALLARRLRVRLTRGMLDRQIAAGRRCDATPALAARASQLTDPRTRRRIAGELQRIVDYVDS